MRPVARRVRSIGPLPIRKISGTLRSGRFAPEPFVDFAAATARGVDFSGLRFEHFLADGSVFESCDFSGCKFGTGHMAGYHQTYFIGCVFDGAQVAKLIPGPTRFEACSFRRARLDDWRPKSAEFVDCTISGRIRNLYFSRKPEYETPETLIPWRDTNEFRGNDFSGAELIFPDFQWGVDLSLNRWPSGPTYAYLENWQERLKRALSEVSKWSASEDRQAALQFIGFHRQGGRGSQQQILFRPSDWAGKAMRPEVMDVLLESFRRPIDARMTVDDA